MRKIITLLLLFAAPLNAAIFYPITTTQPLCCRFSMQQHNRVLIENSRIKKIIFPEEKLHVRMEETSGQVFIQAKSFIKEKVVVSVISQTGVVQDIEIEFSDSPSQVIVLQECISERIPFQELYCQPISPQVDLASVVEAVMKGSIPNGFYSQPITSFCKTVKSGVTAKLVGRLKGSFEDLYIYRLRNVRIWSKRLAEKDLSCRGTSWVYLQKNCLSPKETCLAIVAVGHERKI